MMITLVPMGLLIDGHEVTPAQAMDQATAWLISQGYDAWVIHGLRETMRPVQAWWRDDAGFVQVHHDGAQAVTMVHLRDESVRAELAARFEVRGPAS